MAAEPVPAPVALLSTAHAWRSWQRRAPRLIRSRTSYHTALRTARDTGRTHHGCAIYRALTMALLVQDGYVLTCWPLAWFTKEHADELDP
jgi:hypothetical protein